MDNKIKELINDLTGGIKPGDTIWIVSSEKPVQKRCEHCGSMYYETPYVPREHTVKAIRLAASISSANPLFWECKIEIESDQPYSQYFNVQNVYTSKEKCLEECDRQAHL